MRVKARQCVKCDQCDWVLEVESLEAIKEWHHKMCPVCGKCEIINNEDIVYLNANIEARDLSDLLDPEHKDRVWLHLDSAPLRQGKAFICEEMGERAQ